MNLSEKDLERVRRILWEIKKETHGKCRGIFIDNKLDLISRILRKSERHNRLQRYEKRN